MLRHLFMLNAAELSPKELGRAVRARLSDMDYVQSEVSKKFNDIFVKDDPDKEFEERAVIIRLGQSDHLIPTDHILFFQEIPTFSGGEYACLGGFDLVKRETVAEFLAKPHPHPIRSAINQLTLGILERVCP